MDGAYNVGSVDLESILNVRRRTLASIDEISLPYQHIHCKDTVYVTRESNTNSLYSIQSNVRIYGELQFICRLFERYKSTVFVHENLSAPNVNESDAKDTLAEKENNDENDKNAANNNTKEVQETSETLPLSISPPKILITAGDESTIDSVQRSRRSSTVTSDYTKHNLEGRHYGFIQIPDMNLIEILEVLLRSGLELVNESNGYDQNHVLHQNFIFSRSNGEAHKQGPICYLRQ